MVRFTLVCIKNTQFFIVFLVDPKRYLCVLFAFAGSPCPSSFLHSEPMIRHAHNLRAASRYSGAIKMFGPIDL